MIQRIQSLLLLSAALLNFSTLFLPLWNMENPATGASALLTGLNISITGTATPTQIGPADNNMLLAQMLIVILTTALILFTIFGYQNRPRQLRFTFISRTALVVQILITVLLISKTMPPTIESGDDYPGKVQFGFFFPVAAALLIWFAGKKIKKDEELVKGMERFR